MIVEGDFIDYSIINDISTFKECVDNVIDRMYDDFNNRVCKNCKFDSKSIWCNKSIQRPTVSIMTWFMPNTDFGCNKWIEDGDI